jgi:TfoX/Sxy family transcriptional regulator of competence genes
MGVRSMDWQKASPELGSILNDLLIDFTCYKRPMFGSPCYFVNGNMFTGVFADNIFLRLSEPDRRDILEQNIEVQSFQPRPGMFMKEYVQIPKGKISEDNFVAKWLRLSYDYVSSLPPKEKKPRKKK